MKNSLNEPTFFIIGVQKGGTSTLQAYLTKHPQIYMPEKKELHYFDLFYKKGLNWYLNHFKTDNQENYKHFGEATPYYIFHPLVAKKIHKYFPNAKFIVLLRNPVERAFSHYQMSVRRNYEQNSFEKAIKKENWIMLKARLQFYFTKKFNIKHAEKSYFSRGLYYKQIIRWLKYFDKNQFLFIKSESFFTEPQLQLDKVYEFLNISDFEIKSQKLENKGGYDDEIPNDIKNYLINKYRKDINKLETLVGQEFNWF